MLKITFEFVKLGNARFVVFLKTMLSKVLLATQFSPDLKARATELNEEVNQLHSIATSITANKAQLAQAQRTKVTDGIKDLVNKIESEVRNLPMMTLEEKLAFIHGLDLNTRKPVYTRIRSLKVRMGELEGSVILSTRGQADTYDWWYSTDIHNYTNPVRLESTSIAKREVHGLTRGSYAFFVKAHRRNEDSVVEGPELFTVK